MVVLKMITVFRKYFPQNYMLAKCLGPENLEVFLVSRQEAFADSCCKRSVLTFQTLRMCCNF